MERAGRAAVHDPDPDLAVLTELREIRPAVHSQSEAVAKVLRKGIV